MPEFEQLEVPIRIGVLGDTHRASRNPRALPVAMMRALAECDIIFHTGDVNAPWVLRELEKLAPVRAVRGNNEEPPLDQDLPETLYFQAGPHRIGLIHGYAPGRTGRVYTIETMAGIVDLAIYGHSHIPEFVEHDGLLLLNPGSPTQKRYQPVHSFAMVTVAEEIRAEVVSLEP